MLERNETEVLKAWMGEDKRSGREFWQKTKATFRTLIIGHDCINTMRSRLCFKNHLSTTNV